MTVLCGCGRDYLTVSLGEHDCPSPVQPLKRNPKRKQFATWDTVGSARPREGSMLEHLVFAASRVFDVPAVDIVAKARRPAVVRAREAVVLLVRELSDESFPRLAAQLGGRDHSTIVHVHRGARQTFDGDCDFRQQVERLRALVAPGHRRAVAA